jgi:hypothetical protein
MKRKVLLLMVALSMAAVGSAAAQGATTGGADVSRQLDRLGLHYTLTKSGNYSITFDLDGGRSQTAYIMGKTQKVGAAEIRELWSRAGTMDSLPTEEEMQALLEESGSAAMGFWSIEENDNGGYTIYFSVKVPVYLNDSDLAALLQFTASTADGKEKELFNADDE